MVMVEAQGVFGPEKIELSKKTVTLTCKMSADNQHHIPNSQASLLKLINKFVEDEDKRAEEVALKQLRKEAKEAEQKGH